MSVDDRALTRFALVLVYVLAWFGAFAAWIGLPAHEFNLALAGHYAAAPTTLWDLRWYGGFDVAVAPPLLPELVALAARVTAAPLTLCYFPLLVAIPLACVAGAFAFGRALHSDGAEARLAIVFASGPLLYHELFLHGEVSFYLATALALAATGLLMRGAAEDDPLLLGAGALFGAGALVSHLCAIAILGIAVALMGLVNRRQLRARPRVAMAFIVGLIAAVGIGASALAPTWRALSAIAPRPFLHFVFRDRLAAIAAFGLMLVVGVARWRGRARAAASIVIGAAVLVAVVRTGTLRRLAAAEHVATSPDVGQIAAFLAKNQEGRWRYLTLGIGPRRLALGRVSGANSVDGCISGLPPVPELRGTPWSAIDELPVDNPAAAGILRNIVARDQALRWVFSVAPAASPILTAAGFRSIYAGAGGLVFWSREPGAPPPASAPAHEAPVGLLWRAGPSMLLVAALLSLLSLARRHSTSRAREEEA